MNPNAGNRQDNRQRGNAAQLLEKYKGLARDAQMQGDRVQSEYYLQFADHYYRILNENRARYEEQRRQQGGYDGDEDEDQDQDQDQDREEVMAAEPRGRDRDRGRDRERGSEEGDERREARHQGNGEFRARRGRSRRPEADGDDDAEAGERIAAESLPPAIAIAASSDDSADEPRAPRRRARRPRDGGEEIAPAA